MIMAGGSGTRLWPMSRAERPKQLIPFIGGKSLIEIACDRLDGLVPADQRYICAGSQHRAPILKAVPSFNEDRYLAEPTGRDTLNAVGFAAAVIVKKDPEAIIAVFTADHLIQPVDAFQKIVTAGYEVVESDAGALITFGITPSHAATGYGYLQLGRKIDPARNAFIVDRFKEKPDAGTAAEYFAAGPDKYLWNSGMFVWKAATLMDCIRRYHPKNHEGLMKIADAWDTPARDAVIDDVYPRLEKISVDFAIMEPASQDEAVNVVALPMPVQWLDVGSWPAFAKTLTPDENNNAAAAEKHVLLDCRNTLVATDDQSHLITAIGCEDLLIVHTPDATLVCPADRAQDIKKLHGMVGDRFGEKLT